MSDNPRLKTIFMVDDDKDDCMIVRHAANRIKNAVKLFFFHSGSELLDYFDRLLLGEENTLLPHLILLDLNMPSLGGKEVLETLKKHINLNRIPVAIYTTSDSLRERNECEKLGAAAYIVKPNTLPEIENKLLWLCQHTAHQ